MKKPFFVAEKYFKSLGHSADSPARVAGWAVDSDGKPVVVRSDNPFDFLGHVIVGDNNHRPLSDAEWEEVREVTEEEWKALLANTEFADPDSEYR